MGDPRVEGRSLSQFMIESYSLYFAFTELYDIDTNGLEMFLVPVIGSGEIGLDCSDVTFTQ